MLILRPPEGTWVLWESTSTNTKRRAGPHLGQWNGCNLSGFLRPEGKQTNKLVYLMLWRWCWDSRLVSKVQLSTNKQSQTRHLFYLCYCQLDCWTVAPHMAEIRRVVGGRNVLKEHFLKQTRFLTSYSFLSQSYLCDAVLLLRSFSLSLSICFMWCSPFTALLLLYIHIDIYVLYTLSSFCVFVVTFLYEFDFSSWECCLWKFCF